jgi:hypothetical protein
VPRWRGTCWRRRAEGISVECVPASPVVVLPLVPNRENGDFLFAQDAKERNVAGLAKRNHPFALEGDHGRPYTCMHALRRSMPPQFPNAADAEMSIRSWFRYGSSLLRVPAKIKT